MQRLLRTWALCVKQTEVGLDQREEALFSCLSAELKIFTAMEWKKLGINFVKQLAVIAQHIIKHMFFPPVTREFLKKDDQKTKYLVICLASSDNCHVFFGSKIRKGHFPSSDTEKSKLILVQVGRNQLKTAKTDQFLWRSTAFQKKEGQHLELKTLTGIACKWNLLAAHETWSTANHQHFRHQIWAASKQSGTALSPASPLARQAHSSRAAFALLAVIRRSTVKTSSVAFSLTVRRGPACFTVTVPVVIAHLYLNKTHTHTNKKQNRGRSHLLLHVPRENIFWLRIVRTQRQQGVFNCYSLFGN